MTSQQEGTRSPRGNGYLKAFEKGIQNSIFRLHVKLANVLQNNKHQIFGAIVSKDREVSYSSPGQKSTKAGP